MLGSLGCILCRYLMGYILKMNQTSHPVRILQAILVGGMMALTTVVVTMGPDQERPAIAKLKDSPKAIVDEAWQLVNHHYVDANFNQLDWKAVRHQLLSRAYSSPAQAYTALRQTLGALKDPYTRFMEPDEFETLTTQTEGEVSGIGVRLTIDATTQVLTVLETLPNSPAIKAGIQAKDQILSIDGRSTVLMTAEAAADLMKGKVGTEVKLQLRRAGRPFELAIQRGVIELPSVTHTVKREGDSRIGYLRLTEFNAHSAEQLQAAIESLAAQQVNGFVLDLRGNPGGLFKASIEIADMWLDHGLIVQTANRGGQRESIRARSKSLTQLPLVVLVDGYSASSSEILTGALQDNRRATVVGSATFGKGLVQSVHELADGSGLTITVARYYTPKGTDISKRGIMPDIPIRLTHAEYRALVANPNLLGSASDPFYRRAVKTLKETFQAARTSTHLRATPAVSAVSATVPHP